MLFDERRSYMLFVKKNPQLKNAKMVFGVKLYNSVSWACYHNRSKIAEYLIDIGAEISLKPPRFKRKYKLVNVKNIFVFAVKYEMVGVLTRLFNKKYNACWSFFIACEHCKNKKILNMIYSHIVTYHDLHELLNKGLKIAIRSNNELVVKKIIKHRLFDINECCKLFNVNPPLYTAVIGGQTSMVRIFLENGANPNIIDSNGRILLFKALNNPTIFQLLLDHGAHMPINPMPLLRECIYLSNIYLYNYQTHHNLSGLNLKMLDTIAIIVEYIPEKVKYDIRWDVGNQNESITLLHIACKYNHLKLTKALLSPQINKI